MRVSSKLAVIRDLADTRVKIKAGMLHQALDNRLILKMAV